LDDDSDAALGRDGQQAAFRPLASHRIAELDEIDVSRGDDLRAARQSESDRVVG